MTLANSRSETIAKSAVELNAMTQEQQRDFFGRISIIQESARIDHLPAMIEQRLRAVDRRNRKLYLNDTKVGG